MATVQQCLVYLLVFLTFVLGQDPDSVADISTYDPCRCPRGDGECQCVMREMCERGTIKTNTDGIPWRAGAVRPTCPEEEVCCLVPADDSDEDDDKKNKIPTCGQRGPSFKSLLNKKATSEGEFPWMVAIFRLKGGIWSFHCGASLVHENFVLTAAHCVDKFQDHADDLRVRASVWDLKETGYQERQVDSIILHPQYSRDPVMNDIALLKTADKFRMGLDVSTVCLPTQDHSILPGTDCIATGWGAEKYGATERQNTLKQVIVPVVSNGACQKKLQQTQLGRFFLLHDSFLCAGGKDRSDTCTGDGGGPLVCEIDDTYYQAGIVSWGIGCGVRRLPGVYTNVALYSNWILETIRWLEE